MPIRKAEGCIHYTVFAQINSAQNGISKSTLHRLVFITTALPFRNNILTDCRKLLPIATMCHNIANFATSCAILKNLTGVVHMAGFSCGKLPTARLPRESPHSDQRRSQGG